MKETRVEKCLWRRENKEWDTGNERVPGPYWISVCVSREMKRWSLLSWSTNCIKFVFWDKHFEYICGYISKYDYANCD